MLSNSEKSLTFNEALEILHWPDEKLDQLFDLSEKVRQDHVGNEVLLCGIVNAKSGRCSENCSFCAQSVHHETQAEVYPLLRKDQLVAAQQSLKTNGISCFSIVTAGKGVPQGADFESVLDTLRDFSGTFRCTSMGIATREELMRLKDAGLDKYHHNLETARSFFDKMCSTHTYDDRVETIRQAKAVGLKVCSGGIFGLGETQEQRVELAMELRDLDVDSVPINILHPIEGTRVYGKTEPMSPQDILRLVAMFRLVMPDKIIGVFGGRERNLGEHQPLIFKAGANAMLIGNYLTTSGDPVEKDMQMIRDAGLVPMVAR